MWEDGQDGIYRLNSSQSTSVKRTHELMNSDDAQLVDGLLEKTHDHCRKTMLDNHRGKVNQPKFLKAGASAASALTNLMTDIDDAASVAAPTEASCSGAPPKRFTDLSRACNDASEGVDQPNESEPRSMFESLKGTCKAFAPVTEPKKGKAKAKAKVIPSGPSNVAAAGANKRAGGDQPDAPTKKPRLVESMQPPDAPRGGAKSSSLAEAVAEADKKWLVSAKTEMTAVMIVDPPEESKMKAHLNDISKKSTKLLTSIRYRKRQLRRRTPESQMGPMADACGLEEQLVVFHDLLKLMQKEASDDGNAAGDACYVKCTALIDHGAQFGPGAIKHIARLMWKDDLRWKRWKSMHDVTYKFVKRTCPEEMDTKAFTAQAMNVTLQKLLKDIPAEQVGNWLSIVVQT